MKARFLSLLASLVVTSALAQAIGPGGGDDVSISAPPCSSCTTLAFYVSPSGNDANPGTKAQPFLTLTAAQTAMIASGTKKTTYVRAGSYAPASIANCDAAAGTCGLNLTAADNGETWSYYPPDGVNSASITGGSTSSANGLLYVFYIANTTGVTINGLSIHNFLYGGIAALGGTSTATIKNNIIYNGFSVAAGNPAGISCYGCNSTTVSHNVVHDIASFGISFGNTNGDISNLTLSSNFLYNTCTAVADCGSLYIIDGAATATAIAVTNNFVRDGNTFANFGSASGSGIYLDNCTSNATVTGNVVAGLNGSNTIDTHGGINDHINGNLVDLASYAQNIATWQTAASSGCSTGAMTGNQFKNNVAIGKGGGGGYLLLGGSPLNPPTITNNDYWNYGVTAAISSTGSYTDASPSTQDPSLSGWNYTMSGGSAVLSAPVSFPGVTAGWGPPGYVIPQTGTPPAYFPPILITVAGSANWTVPAGVTLLKSVKAIGAGAGAGSTNPGGGAGGAAFAEVDNISVTAGSNLAYVLPAAGASSTNGGDTYFNGALCATATVCAKGGNTNSGAVGGLRGLAATSVGTIKFDGGDGGLGTTGGNGGGGGAGGPNGAGAIGGAGNSSGGAGGGGGNGGGTAGAAGGVTLGGNGGNNFGGIGGGAGATASPGTKGGGGGGAGGGGGPGGKGGPGIDIGGSPGSGGGGGGDNGTGTPGGLGGLYGGGAGARRGATGGQGLLVIDY